jgi:hypothetical protein
VFGLLKIRQFLPGKNRVAGKPFTAIFAHLQNYFFAKAGGAKL